MKKGNKGIGVYVAVMAAIVVILLVATTVMNQNDTYRYNDFINDIREKNVDKVVVIQNKEVPTGKLQITMSDGTIKQLYIPDINKTISEIEGEVASVNEVDKAAFYLKNNQKSENESSDGKTEYEEYKVDVRITDVQRDSVFLTTILPILLMAVFIVVFFLFIGFGGAGSNGKMANFGKSRAKLVVDTKNINFDKVAGLKEEKEELEEVVDFLKNPQKYINMGARIPKGILLEGPPGTGKTLLAKAISGEAGVPFFTISGSDFVEMFVGVGASRVRDLFADAKKNSPCIVFIDEIDAVARRRGTGMGGGHDEREQTLNQLLVEMDGFGVNEGIIVMAATNRVDILDPAILRPGRFDRKVMVGRPDVEGRKEILAVHAANKKIGDDVDFDTLARNTVGFTGADIENLLNEAAIMAAKEEKQFITGDIVEKAFIKIGVGKEKKSRVVTEKEKRITAYHEGGHAILFHVLPDVGPVHTISIIPTGLGAAGYTMPLQEKDDMFLTKNKILQEIMVDLGGRIAEEMIFDDITTGASQDIKQATARAKSMVTKYGMSKKLGLINYDEDGHEVFIGRDLAHSKGYGEATASAIDAEVREIVDKCYNKAKQIISDYMLQLEECANLLLEKEKIERSEFEKLFDNVEIKSYTVEI